MGYPTQLNALMLEMEWLDNATEDREPCATLRKRASDFATNLSLNITLALSHSHTHTTTQQTLLTTIGIPITLNGMTIKQEGGQQKSRHVFTNISYIRI